MSWQRGVEYKRNVCKTNRNINYALLICAVVTMLFACWLYICYRSKDLLLYSWLHIDNSSPLFVLLRITDWKPNNWMIYNLPDGLWLLSYLLFAEALWDKTSTKYVFVIGMIIIAICIEILQCMNILPGTGDIWDVLCYTAAIGFYCIIVKFKKYYHEKNG